MKYCTKCLTPATRPRMTFNKQGVCNGCQWDEIKKTKINWQEKRRDLQELCDEYRSKDGSNWDMIVPCSGGKDSDYIAWKMKHEFKMRPLLVTLVPHMETEVGRINLQNIIKCGFDHIAISPNPKDYVRLARKGLIEQGQPKLPFVMGISTVVTKVAINFKIPFVMWGEDGEAEYGGSMQLAYKYKIDRDYLVNCYYNGHDPAEYLNEFSKQELLWWLLPSQEEMDRAGLFQTHWSKFECWDDILHKDLAIKECGLQTTVKPSFGTFTNYAQLEESLQHLHIYLMFIKFGWGRATADANLAIKAGRMTRDEALKIVREKDGRFPEEYLPSYLDYFKMTEEEFWGVIDSWANREILKRVDGMQRWDLKEPAH